MEAAVGGVAIVAPLLTAPAFRGPALVPTPVPTAAPAADPEAPLYIIGMMAGFVATISAGGFVAETLCTVRLLNWMKPESGGGAIGIGGETMNAGADTGGDTETVVVTSCCALASGTASAITKTEPTAAITANFFIFVLFDFRAFSYSI